MKNKKILRALSILLLISSVFFLSGCEKETNYLTIEKDGKGITSPAAGSHEYTGEKVVDLEARPHDDWEFDRWTGNVGNIDDPSRAETKILVDKNKTIYANFNEKSESETDSYTLSINIDGEGSVDPEARTHEYNKNEEVDIKAEGKNDWEFAEWKGDTETIEEPEKPETKILMDSDKEIEAVFQEKNNSKVTLTIEKPESRGSTSPPEGTYEYEKGKEITVEAEADENWSFSRWNGDIESNFNEKTPTITMDKDRTIQAEFSPPGNITGEGTERDPYIVYTFAGLEEVGDEKKGYEMDAWYELGYDIEADNTENDIYNQGDGWDPIGGPDYEDDFEGVFNGKGYTISSLHLENDCDRNLGFFGVTADSAIIKNLNLKNVYLEGNTVDENEYIGGLVGYNEGDISGCSVTGKIKGVVETGGLVGGNYGGNIENSFSDIELDGNDHTGGLVGYNASGIIEKSFATGEILIRDDITASNGGLVGRTYNGSISQSFADVQIKASNSMSVGGLVGSQDKGDIKNSYAHGDCTGEENVGGLAGYNNSNIKYSFSTGEVTGKENIGGLIGKNENTKGEITDSYYDKDTSLMEDENKGTPKNTEGMKEKDTFSSWNFKEVWSIDENSSYPYLQWEK